VSGICYWLPAHFVTSDTVTPAFEQPYTYTFCCAKVAKNILFLFASLTFISNQLIITLAHYYRHFLAQLEGDKFEVTQHGSLLTFDLLLAWTHNKVEFRPPDGASLHKFTLF
jgi:hypothetical protein